MVGNERDPSLALFAAKFPPIATRPTVPITSATDDPAVTHTEPSYATPAGMM
jgi:hypothetical protein